MGWVVCHDLVIYNSACVCRRGSSCYRREVVARVVVGNQSLRMNWDIVALLESRIAFINIASSFSPILYVDSKG